MSQTFNRQTGRANTRDRQTGFSLLEVIAVLGITTVVAAIAVPMMKNTIGDFKLSGDARGLTNAVSLAKLRAASDFSQSRLFVDRDAQSFHVEVWSKTAVPPDWVTEGGVDRLSPSDTSVSAWSRAAPANTRPDRQAPPCVTPTRGGHRQYLVHPVQLARHSGRFSWSPSGGWRADRQRCRLPDG